MRRICARNLVCRHKQRKAKIILILDPRSLPCVALSRRDPNNAWSANEQAVGLVSQSASQLLEMLSKQNEDPLVSSIDRESFPLAASILPLALPLPVCLWRCVY